MLGRTHMAIGALGAVLTVPILLHGGDAHVMLTGHGSFFKVEQIVAGWLAGALGGILPDLDQKDSLMSRRVERIGQAIAFFVFTGLFITLHLWMSLTTVIIGVFALLAVLSQAEWMRKASLLLIAAGILGWGLTHESWFEVAILVAIWLVVTTFSAHRTFTHSFIGLSIAGVTLIQLGIRLHVSWLTETVLLGYALHLAADTLAGGIPFLWPYSKRQGVALVKTGGLVDHLIGSACALLVLTAVFV